MKNVQRHVWKSGISLTEKMMKMYPNLVIVNEMLGDCQSLRNRLLNPFLNPQIKQLLHETFGHLLNYIWLTDISELRIYCLSEIADLFFTSVQKYLISFHVKCVVNEWMSIEHQSVRDTINAIQEQTNVEIFHAIKDEQPLSILLAMDERNLKIGHKLLSKLTEV